MLTTRSGHTSLSAAELVAKDKKAAAALVPILHHKTVERTARTWDEL